jgi:dihydroneopterin aldolase
VPEEERRVPQRLTLSITMFPTADFRNLGDEIENAVNYAAVCDEVRAFVGKRSDKLIETLADAVASHLLEKFPLRKVRIELRKFILPDVDHVAVLITRPRS